MQAQPLLLPRQQGLLWAFKPLLPGLGYLGTDTWERCFAQGESQCDPCPQVPFVWRSLGPLHGCSTPAWK